MALINFPAVGSLVEYHGSVTAEHGLYRVMGDCECPECEEIERSDGAMDYRLSLVNEYYVRLDHVRLESVSVAP